ncbi:amidohydrolase family protein, partial [bacterium]|nr:amidohydrolase family protein [bacterium]
ETPFGDHWLRIGTMKLFADGSMGAGSALISQPYPGDESNYGLAIYEPEELNRLICEIDAAGLQIAVHAIGDVANQQVLNAFELARNKNGNQPTRHRIEHAQMVQSQDVERFAALGVIASVQPSHAIDDMRWAEKRIGADLIKDAYRVQSFRDAGVTVVFGTDWPVEPLNPLLGIYAAVTREAIGGGPENGWQPHEKMNLANAIESYTLLPAFAEFSENLKGSLVPGKLADLQVLENNIFEIEPAGWLETKVLLTMVDGKITWREGRI